FLNAAIRQGDMNLLHVRVHLGRRNTKLIGGVPRGQGAADKWPSIRNRAPSGLNQRDAGKPGNLAGQLIRLFKFPPFAFGPTEATG
ncbi:MAG TPA: hypothetical protein VEM60_02110, partial [Candidatus Dormibacteraeota bacterium]|nr:hypothetical protein [Candidatus Dormibacteraeota bacterium]